MGLSGNPVLDHLDQKFAELHPLAQAALRRGLMTGGIPLPTGLETAQPSAAAALGGGIPAAPAAAAPAIVRPLATPSPARPIVPRESPEQQARIAELNRLQSTGSGISQIGGEHPSFGKKLVRGLAHTGEAIGAMFGPTRAAEPFIPGTEAHHQLLLNRAGTAVKQGEEVENEQAKRAVEEATLAGEPTKEDLERAQAEQARAHAHSLLNPQPKEEAEGRTITTDQGIFQWNPETKRYDVKAGNAPGPKQAGTVHQLEDGTLIMAHPDGTATPVTINGKPARGKVPKEPLEERIINEHMTANPGETLAEARRHTEANPPDKGQNFIDPSTGKLVRVEPGQKVPQGGTTPTQYGSLFTPSGQTKSRAEQATAIIEAGHNLSKLIDDPKYKPVLGNLESYWDQAINGTPIADPAASRMMADIGSYVALQPAMHGFRSGEALREFARLIGGIPKNADALKEAIQGIEDTARVVAKTGHPGSAGGTGGTGDMITVTTVDGQTGQIHATQKERFLKDHPGARVQGQ